MQLRIITICLLLCLCFNSFSQDLIQRTLEGTSLQSTNEPNEIAKTLSTQHNLKEITTFDFANRQSDENGIKISLKMGLGAIKALKNSENTDIRISVPVAPDVKFSLILKRVNILSPNFSFKDHTGKILDFSGVHQFRGIIEGDHGSLVSLSLVNEEIHISITDQDGTYRINPDNPATSIYKFYAERLPADVNISCGTTDEMIPGFHRSTIQENNDKSAGDLVEIYVECDYQLYLDKGGVEEVEIYVANLFNEVATIYANENITISVSDVVVWTIPDPYRNMSLSNVSAILDAFGSLTQNTYNGRLATLLIGRVPNGNGVGGIAWVDVLCETYNPVWQSGPYSVNYGFGRFPLNGYPSYSLDVSIITHELGHNFGSPHTHNCSWGPSNNRAIDNCPGYTEGGCGLVTSPTPESELGTIMSYCGNIDFTKGFGSEPGALIYDRYLNAGCLTPGNLPCTHNNKTYSNTAVSSTEVIADNNIILNNLVTVLNNATITWQAENEWNVYGTFILPVNANLTVISDNCQ